MASIDQQPTVGLTIPKKTLSFVGNNSYFQTTPQRPRRICLRNSTRRNPACPFTVLVLHIKIERRARGIYLGVGSSFTMLL